MSTLERIRELHNGFMIIILKVFYTLFLYRDVFVVRLISADTVEEEILALAQKKLELEKEVTGASAAESKSFH